ncbi:SDR family NAD(P)-dependent oxidoreductase [Cognatishimia sp. F0-27]|uniref:SDR family NAD(P)-dependent oxidoreductase n=1 Tax=Cognatishimia sp. F0-27 TaxID=2816855 RepID=UPI001D0CCBC4|nr:SDR family oxidoreductase [Cognatishimia sp. F0-27]MCC1493788.1 SDR family oxidoreductase [Cognatishimia sp. F0-27]
MSRRVLVTGGGSGIGRDVARHFAQAGDAVTITGRRMAALEETAKGTHMTCVEADVTDEAAIDAVFAAPFDVVVANAGSGWPAKITETSLEMWERTLRVNLTGVFLTFRAALRDMPEGGRLIAIASTAALQGGATIPAYAASKHGVLGLVRSVAQDVAKRGITCNAVCPGFVDTPMSEKAVDGLAARLEIPREKALSMIVSGNPMARMISTGEVTSAVAFLASAGASMVNGHALSVSGGET